MSPSSIARPAEPVDASHTIVSSRDLPWPRALVYAAFADPEQLALWWGPKDFRNSFESFDFRPGGAWRFVMHGPDGTDYKNRSEFIDIIPDALIVLDHVSGPPFRMTIRLDDLGGSTRIGWEQRFKSKAERDRIAAYAVPANEENFDRLAAHLARRAAAAASGPIARSVTHATFTIRREYDATPERVFAAFADPKLKALWFGGPPEWTQDARIMDFRVGGVETNGGGPKGGPIHRFRAIYQDIVPNERIVYSYDMHLDDIRISVSLATIEIRPHQGGARLVLTEQGAFLDGFDDAGGREHGTRELLDQLGASLSIDAAH